MSDEPNVIKQRSHCLEIGPAGRCHVKGRDVIVCKIPKLVVECYQDGTA